MKARLLELMMGKTDIDTTLPQSGMRLQDLLESLASGVIVVDESHRILMVNSRFAAMFGYDRSEVIGRFAEMFLPEHFVNQPAPADENCRNTETRPTLHTGESLAHRKDGSEFPVDIHQSVMATADGMEIVVTVSDISEQKRIEMQLEYHAGHDGLTGLPNRNLLEDRIGQVLLHAERLQQRVAVLFVDLDHFKVLLAGLSHDLGDRLMLTVAERLKACVREHDTVARMGDDVFVIVLSNLRESEDAAKVARKVHDSIRRPVEMVGRTFEVSCSIGITVHPKDGKDVRTLVKNAEVAMFRAKERGRGCFQFFTDQLNDRIAARITMEHCLRKAVENNELSMHYQPQMDLRTGRMIGCEALIRWQSPDLGAIPPGKFIPLSEETGLIIPIGEWVLKTACFDNKRWQNMGHPALPVAVNLSPRQFWDPCLVETIGRVLRDSGLDARYLELEITEGMVMRDVENALAMLRDLKGLGVELSIDDFGTGYSNLSHLKRFPFDKLKMDITFVRDITHDPGCAAIARTIIAMAHNLNLRVIAEGIETEGQFNYLRFRGCDEMQGFYFSKALACRDFEQILVDGRMLQFPKQSEERPGRTLLLVDDEPFVLSTLARVLHDQGYGILTAGKAGDGFELLANNRIGVVLSDLRMPGMDGVEFLSRVSSLHPDTIRIAMSGYADMEMVTETINRGAIYKFLTKPIDNVVLRQTIMKAFEQFEIRLKHEQ